MKIPTKLLGQELKRLRVYGEKAMSIETAALLIGVDYHNLWSFEEGRKPFPLSYLKRAAEVYGVDINTLVSAYTKDFENALMEKIYDDQKG